MSYRTAEDHAKETSSLHRLLKGMIRRMAVKLTSSAKWQLLGYRGGTGGDETVDVEPFTGIGFYSRPPSSGKPEAIMAAVGGTKTPAIVATRDEATRKLAVGDLAEGETAVYNDKAVIVLKADGTVEIRLVGGVAIPLATKQDLIDLRTKLLSWVPVAMDGGAALKLVLTTWLGPGPVYPWPVGTTVLKGQ